MQSERNLTPEQLWISGLQKIAFSGNIIASEVFESPNEVRKCYITSYIPYT